MSRVMNGWRPLTAARTLVKEVTMTREQIIERCQQCGLVGLGGATFPTHIKMTVLPGRNVTC